MEEFADATSRIQDVTDYDEVMDEVAEIDVSGMETGQIGVLRVYDNGQYTIDVDEWNGSG